MITEPQRPGRGPILAGIAIGSSLALLVLCTQRAPQPSPPRATGATPTPALQGSRTEIATRDASVREAVAQPRDGSLDEPDRVVDLLDAHGVPIASEPIRLVSSERQYELSSDAAGRVSLVGLENGSYRVFALGEDYVAASSGGGPQLVVVEPAAARPTSIQLLPVMVAGIRFSGREPVDTRFVWDRPIHAHGSGYDAQQLMERGHALRQKHGRFTKAFVVDSAERITGTLSGLFPDAGIHQWPVELVPASQYRPYVVESGALPVAAASKPGTVVIKALSPSNRQINIGNVAVQRLTATHGFQNFTARCDVPIHLPPGTYTLGFGPADFEPIIVRDGHRHRFELAAGGAHEVVVHTSAECRTTRWTAAPRDSAPMLLRFGYPNQDGVHMWSAIRAIVDRELVIALPVGAVKVASVPSADATADRYEYTTLDVAAGEEPQLFDSAQVVAACEPYTPQRPTEGGR
jgi:hypothetical protein